MHVEYRTMRQLRNLVGEQSLEARRGVKHQEMTDEDWCKIFDLLNRIDEIMANDEEL